ncbi:hypothetical protein L1987_53627 [Smallanthus sonchifolius]|uniref:Uncharacterized protein n=1 Tax=Smallanthus sonchifolius TaxID=185202 RepID=A0ACB9EWV3_9ASTR|nr:hypothetical protein L1987_53627 [Smallanthus sonchifolius]
MRLVRDLRVWRFISSAAYLAWKEFIQVGGLFINYYMYHGGTNFGRTAVLRRNDPLANGGQGIWDFRW